MFRIAFFYILGYYEVLIYFHYSQQFSNSCLRLVSKRNAFLFSLPGIFIPELEENYTEVEAPSK